MYYILLNFIMNFHYVLKKGVNIIKKVWNYLKVSLALSPFWFVFNIIVLIIFRLTQLGTDYALKYVTDVILNFQKVGSGN